MRRNASVLRYLWWPALLVCAGNFLAVLTTGLHPSFATIRLIYNFNTLILPLLLALSGLVLLGLRTQRKRAAGRQVALRAMWYLVACVVLLTVRVYCSFVEPRALQLRHVSIRSAKIRTPVRLLHISDIQSPTVGTYEERAFARMRELNPDLVIFTGDLLQTRTTSRLTEAMPKMSRLLDTLQPRLGKYGVYGDTDWRIAHRNDRVFGGMRFLCNEEILLQHGETRLRLFGLDLARSHGAHNPGHAAKGWLANAHAEDFTVLFGHAPDFVLDLETPGPDLSLAGHTHGGQVRLPWAGPLVTLSRVPRHWARGFHQTPHTQLNVSAGIGSEHADDVPPIRFLCPTEMTLIDILPEGNAPTRRIEAAPSDPIHRTVIFFADNLPSSRMLLFGGPVSLLWALCCLFWAGYLKRVRGLRTGYTRKIFHFLIFISAAAVHIVWGTRGVCLFGGMTTLVVFYAVFKGSGHLLYEAMAREKDAPHRTMYILSPYFATLIGGLAANIFFGKLAVIGYLVTGLGDAIGEPIGTRFGRHPYRVPALGGVRAIRTLEGSAAVLVACFGALLLGILLVPGLDLQIKEAAIALAIALVCTGCEAISPHGWDNLVLQLMPVVLANIWLAGGVL